MNILEVNDLSIQFGKKQVLDRLTFNAEEQSIFGFIGKNGAGKTTTMKLILGLLPASAGDISVCGEPVRYGNSRANRSIGYLPDVPAFYPYMTSMEYLRLSGKITGLPAGEVEKRAKELLRLVGLKETSLKIRGYSRGMKQRLGIAQALLSKPRLFLCDEPTSALDPAGRKEILDILRRVREQTTVLFSTHVLSDVESICDTVGILDNGRLRIQGKLEEIRSAYRQDVILISTLRREELPRFQALAEELPSVSGTEMKDTGVELRTGNLARAGNDLLELSLREAIPLLHYEIMEPKLEHIFLEVTE